MTCIIYLQMSGRPIPIFGFSAALMEQIILLKKFILSMIQDLEMAVTSRTFPWMMRMFGIERIDVSLDRTREKMMHP